MQLPTILQCEGFVNHFWIAKRPSIATTIILFASSQNYARHYAIQLTKCRHSSVPDGSSECRVKDDVTQFHVLSLWRSDENLAYTEGVLSAVEIEKSTWYHKWVESSQGKPHIGNEASHILSFYHVLIKFPPFNLVFCWLGAKWTNTKHYCFIIHYT